MRLVSSLPLLRAALTVEASPANVLLPAGTRIELGGEALQVPLGANVSIVGEEGATIDAGGLSRVFEVFGVISLRGLRLTGPCL